MLFPTDYNSIIEKVNHIDPVDYARTRNYIDGSVTGLSPYISRGVISLPMIACSVLRKYKPWQIEKFLQELAWREYWQRVWQHTGEKIFTDIRQQQQPVFHHEMVSAIAEARTGIEAIDNGIQLLYQYGYMHNHLRMYTASIACNIAQAHWHQPSQWMYYHLLDGDIASNTLSWQWVAGSFSSKKYFCNQANINRFTYSNQQHSFLDYSYEELATAKVPEHLRQSAAFQLTTELPLTAKPVIKANQPVLLYNSYNLDPLWHPDETCNRVLLLEPSHFKQYPVSKKVMQFIIGLAANIPGIQIFTGEWEELKQLAGNNTIIVKKHPAFMHYAGRQESYDELFPAINRYFPSFSGYWKHCEKHIPDLVRRATTAEQ